MENSIQTSNYKISNLDEEEKKFYLKNQSDEGSLY